MTFRGAVRTLAVRAVGAALALAGTVALPPSSARGQAPSHPQAVEWDEPDSTMAALLARAGYTATRYQGDTIVLGVRDSTLTLRGRDVAVTREGMLVVGDTVVFDGRAGVVRVRGDTIILRDPSRAAEDLVALGRLDYDLRRREGLATGVATQAEHGETWFVHGDQVGFRSERGGTGRAAFYALGGSFTSCELKEPHYHFRADRVKVVPGKRLVARSAVLHVGGVPVLWLPFIFQDLRAGRRSGLLVPRLGVGELARTNARHRRQVDGLGYYASLGDYMDAEVSLDWRSAAGAQVGDPGWLRYNAGWRYRWLDRFLSGRLAVSHLALSDRRTNTSVAWTHDQSFSTTRRLAADVNYVTSTAVQRQTALHPYQALATIHSQLAYTHRLGPLSVALGGSQRQYPGQPQVDRELPTISITSRPLALAPWLVWTPTFAATNSQNLRIDLAALGLTPTSGQGATRGDRRNTTVSLDTPLQIGGFTWRNAFRLSERVNAFPEPRTVEEVRPRLSGGVDTVRATRVFASTYLTTLDWETGLALPSLSQGRWNLTPSLQVENVDPSGLWVRSERTGRAFVRQPKRLVYGLSAAPTMFAFVPGFGPFARLRHSINPVVSYGYATAATVGDAFLAALGRSRRDYLGALAQNRVTLALRTDVEARLRVRGDSAEGTGNPMRLLSLTFDALTYDFERARVTGRTGLVNDAFGYTARSDLLPGLDLTVRYSLFQGDPLSDTARFRPYRESVHASLSLGRAVNPFVTLERLFGRAVPLGGSASPRAPVEVRADTSGPAAGGQDWHATFAFVSSRPRPPVGANAVTVDPRARCAAPPPGLAGDGCFGAFLAVPTQPTPFPTTLGGPVYRVPALTTLQSHIGFDLTPNWGAQWLSTYDFGERAFAAHAVTLRRDLHDWSAVFGITRTPGGISSFNFSIALNARPEVRFDHDRHTYGGPSPF